MGGTTKARARLGDASTRRPTKRASTAVEILIVGPSVTVARAAAPEAPAASGEVPASTPASAAPAAEATAAPVAAAPAEEAPDDDEPDDEEEDEEEDERRSLLVALRRALGRDDVLP